LANVDQDFLTLYRHVQVTSAWYIISTFFLSILWKDSRVENNIKSHL